MKLYERISIYKITNDVDKVCFFGHTTSSLAARFTSLKHEADDTKRKKPVLDHMRKLGKEHFEVHHATTLSSITLDEVKARIKEFAAQANQARQATEQQTDQSEPKSDAQTDAEPHHPQTQETEAERPPRQEQSAKHRQSHRERHP